jgi:hypothetical protein
MMDLQKEMPAWVQFEVRGVEDRDATIKNGHYTERDVEFALITPPYSKDCVEKEVAAWLVELDEHVRNHRLPETWASNYKAKYRAWKDGLEIPEDGIPIKGWTMVSPAVQNNLLQIGVRTVEALAKMNDEGMKRYGMGALDLKNRAIAWLKAAKNVAPVAQENAALKAQVGDLITKVEQLMTSNAELKARIDDRERVAA